MVTTHNHEPGERTPEESFEAPLPRGAAVVSSGPSAFAHFRRTLRRGPALVALLMLGAVVSVAFCAPLLGTMDPIAIDPGLRLRLPSNEH